MPSDIGRHFLILAITKCSATDDGASLEKTRTARVVNANFPAVLMSDPIKIPYMGNGTVIATRWANLLPSLPSRSGSHKVDGIGAFKKLV